MVVVLGIGSMIAGGAAATAAGYIAGGIGYAIISGLVAAGVSYFGAKALGLTPKLPDASEFAAGIMLNKQSNDSFLPVIYGRRRVGGTIVFMQPSGTNNKYLNIVLVLCEGEIEGVSSIYFNDIEIVDGKFIQYVKYEVYTGADDQTASALLITESGGKWTSNHRLRGVAYIYLRLEYNQTMFPSGMPTITADVSGKKVYDTRISTTLHSTNPVMCIRDYLVNTRYGRGLDSALIDATSFNSAANYCDDQVSRPGIGSGEGVTFTSARPYKFAPLYIDTVTSSGTTRSTFINDIDPSKSVEITVSKAQLVDVNNLQIGETYFISGFNPSSKNGLYKYTSKLDRTSTVNLLFDVLDSNGNTTTNSFSSLEYLTFSSLEYLRASTTIESGVNKGGTTNYIHGRSLPASDITIRVSTTIGGETEMKRYTLNGVTDTEEGSIDVLNKMLTSCRGMLIFSGGKYKLIIDKPETASFIFNADNIIRAWTITLGNKTTKFNRIKATFYNPDKNWQSDVAIVDNTSYRASDNGVMLSRDIELPYTSGAYIAQEIARINLAASRYQTTCAFKATIEALRCEVGDVVYITHDTPGWTEKKFRVVNLRMQNAHEVDVTCIEYADAVYDYTLSQVDPTPSTTLPDPFANTPPTALTWTLDKYGQFGIGIFTWTAPEDSFTDYYRLDIVADAYTTGAMTEAQRQGVRRELSISGTEYTVTDLPEGSYTAMVQSISTYGGLSAPSITTMTIPAPPMLNRVSGLEIDNGSDGDNNAATWEGRDVRIVWRPASVSYGYDINNEEAQGAESGATDWYLKDYKVEVYNSTGALLRTEYVTDTWYVYTHSKNLDDATKQGASIYRILSFKVWARGKQNQISAQAAIL